jgi:hypothetical protein
MSSSFRFTLLVLATWRVTHLLASEDGPVDLIVQLRAALGQSKVGTLLDCFYCLSLWIAAPAALFVTRDPLEWLFSWLAASGGACVLERIFSEKQTAVFEPLAAMVKGEANDVLRTETITAQQSRGT